MQGQPAGGEATEHHGEPPPVRRRQSHPRRDRHRKRRLHGVVSAIGPDPVTPPAPAAAAQSSNCALRTSQRWWMERVFEDAKGQCGLADYQVQGWLAWHHHVTMVIPSYSCRWAVCLVILAQTREFPCRGKGRIKAAS